MIQALMVCGEPFEVFFQIKSDAVTPKPITGYAAKIELRNNRENGALLHSFDDNSPEISRDDAAGQVRLKISALTTSTLKFQKAYLDLWLSNEVDGVRSAVVAVTLERGVTQP